MKLLFHELAWADYLHWQEADPKILARINTLIRECERTPFQGNRKAGTAAGQPVGLVVSPDHGGTSPVYRMEKDELLIAQCRFHYDR